MIWRAGPDMGCDYFNRPWLEFTGRAMEQELGFGWAEGVHPDDRDRCLATFTEAFRARRPFVMDYRLRRFDGVWRDVVDQGAPYVRDGVFAGYFGSCVDVTEALQARVERDAALRTAERHARELQHRMRNNQQNAISLVAFLGRRRPHAPLASIVPQVTQRLRAVADAESVVDRFEDTPLNAAAFIEEFLRTNRPWYRFTCDPVAAGYGWPGERMRMLAQVLNELLNLEGPGPDAAHLTVHDGRPAIILSGTLDGDDVPLRTELALIYGRSVDVTIARADGTVVVSWNP